MTRFLAGEGLQPGHGFILTCQPHAIRGAVEGVVILRLDGAVLAGRVRVLRRVVRVGVVTELLPCLPGGHPLVGAVRGRCASRKDADCHDRSRNGHQCGADDVTYIVPLFVYGRQSAR
jgi:hypothetical protein